jgi:predicted nucleic acid-binding protein
MDTNHVTAWEANDAKILVKMTSLPPGQTLVFTSVITLGEIAASFEMTSGDPKRRHAAANFLNIYAIPYAVNVTPYTRGYYGQIVGRIWKKWSPASSSKKTEVHLVSLGVDINDVWIVACAWEHGLILLTTDAMTNIKSVVPEVTWDSWL